MDDGRPTTDDRPLLRVRRTIDHLQPLQQAMVYCLSSIVGLPPYTTSPHLGGLANYPVGRQIACRKAPAHFAEVVLKLTLLKALCWTLLSRLSQVLEGGASTAFHSLVFSETSLCRWGSHVKIQLDRISSEHARDHLIMARCK